MKKLLTLSLILLGLWSCSSDNENNTYLYVDQKEIEFDGFYKGETIINISSSFGWSVSIEDNNTENWIVLDKYIGDAGETTLTIRTMQENKDSERTCILRISNGDHKEAVVNIKQLGLSQSKPFLTSEYNIVDLNISASDTHVKVLSNQEWEVTSSPSWLSLSQMNGKESETLTLTTIENYEYADKEGIVIFKTKKGDISYELKVSQQGRNKSYYLHFSYLFPYSIHGTPFVESKRIFVNQVIRENVFLGNLIYPKTFSFPQFTFPKEYTYNDITCKNGSTTHTMSPSLVEQDTYVQSTLANPPREKATFKDNNWQAQRFYNYKGLAEYGLIDFGVSFDKLLNNKTYKEQEMNFHVGMIFSFSHSLFTLNMEKPTQLTKETISDIDQNNNSSYISEISYGKIGLLIVEAYNHDNLKYDKLHQAARSLIKGNGLVSEAEAWLIFKDARFSYIYFNNKNEIQVIQTSPQVALEAYKSARNNSGDKLNIYPIGFKITGLDDFDVPFEFNYRD